MSVQQCYCPQATKYIQVPCRVFISQFTGTCELGVNLFYALIRLASQEDDELFLSFGSSRWRHYIESDFMVISCMDSYLLLVFILCGSTCIIWFHKINAFAHQSSVLSGAFDLFDANLYRHLFPLNTCYDLSKSKLVTFCISLFLVLFCKIKLTM